MAIGKGSLGRVASATVIASASAEVAETVAVPAETKKATAATKESKAPKKASAQRLGNKRYAVGDALPEYLL